MRYVIFHNAENTQGAEWWPTLRVVLEGAKGGLYGRSRRSPDATWGPPFTIAEGIILDDARAVCKERGLSEEVVVG